MPPSTSDVSRPSNASYLVQTLDLLDNLVPSDAIAWVSLNLTTRRSAVFGFPNDAPDEEVSRELLELEDDHPMIVSYWSERPHGLPAPRRLSDLVSDRQLRATKTYALLLRPVNRIRQLTVVVSQGQDSRSWTLNRARRDFSDREVELVARLQPSLFLLERSYGGSQDEPSPEASDRGKALTEKEWEVMRLAGRGLTAVAIAHVLRISPRTVTKHVEHVYLKLGCNNRVSALRALGL